MVAFVFLDIFQFLVNLYSKFIGRYHLSKIKDRIVFEEKNYNDKACESFSKSGIKAHACFEVSSEGELEQVRPIIVHFLSQKLYVELIYCSESVERQVQNFFHQYKDNLRILRLPLVTHNNFSKNKNSVRSWMTSENLYLCRYDFFPELLLLGRKAVKNFILISGTMKGKDLSKNSILKNYLYKKIYQSFDLITVPTQKDKNLFKLYYEIDEQKVVCMDFRVLQIDSRLKSADKVLVSRIPGWSHIQSFFDKNIQKIFVWGSFWPEEMDLLDKNLVSKIAKRELIPVLVPHNLDATTIGKIKLSIKQKSSQVKIIEIKADDDDLKLRQEFSEIEDKPVIIILNMKGVLCEFYKNFRLAIVGGGHGRSVHSLLEPYLAGCNLLCGPKVFRSTEYDIIKERSQDYISIFENGQDLTSKLKEMISKPNDMKKRIEFIENTMVSQHEFYTQLENLYDSK